MQRHIKIIVQVKYLPMVADFILMIIHMTKIFVTLFVVCKKGNKKGYEMDEHIRISQKILLIQGSFCNLDKFQER